MPALPSYRNQSIDLLCKSIDLFLRAILALNGLIIVKVVILNAPLKYFSPYVVAINTQYNIFVREGVQE